MFGFSQGLVTRYDQGMSFRLQEPRTLNDIDQLYQRMQQLRLTIGLERADSIEKSPESFTDGDSFRI